MQLNGKEIRGIRSFRSFWTAILFFVVGIVFVGLGIYFFISPDQGKTYKETTAVITEIGSETIGEDEIKFVIVKYLDAENNEHKDVRLNAFDSSWTIGKEIEIRYNVNNFEDIQRKGSQIVVPIVFVGLGSIAVFASIALFVKTLKLKKQRTPKEVDEKNQKDLINDKQVENIKNTKLFFRFGGKMNQSYFVTNKEGEHVFECNLKWFNIFGFDKFEFVDNMTGNKKLFKMGKTSTSSASGGLPFVGDTLSSNFKIDGTNCWEYLSQKGYEVKHNLGGKTVVYYELVKNKKTVAKIVPANIKDPFNENSTNFLRMGKGCYRLEIIDANLADVVLTAFIISRTDMVE
ncbi:MAG: hypothetical protein IJ538_02385 [Clostridia bacterium]|nr:hypothetical protein [Clostridia bacterium]